VEESFDTFLTRIKEKEEVFVMEYGEFQSKHPDLYKQAINEGRDAAKNDAAALVTAESVRIIGIASAVLGKEQGDKLNALVTSGVTVEQIAAFSQVMGKPAPAQKDEGADEAAKEKQAFIQGKMQEIKNNLASSIIIDPEDLTEERVVFGSTVTIEDVSTEEVIQYLLVGPFESDVDENKISVTSPIGKGLIGKEIGDVVSISTPGGVKEFEIIDISINDMEGRNQ